MADGNTALRVFISYARADGSTLAEDLKTGLEIAGFAPFLDRHDIAAGEDWESRLAALIQAADTVVFLVSPAAVRSERCAWEVETAETLSKRVLPILAVNVPESDTPESLRRRNYVKFTDGRSFASGLRELAAALRENVTWIREHTRLAELAARWRQRQRPEDLLLRGAELESARAWLSQWASPAPEPTAAHREYIGASEAAELERGSAERRRLEIVAAAQADRAVALARSRRVLFVAGGLLALLLVVTVVGGLHVLRLDGSVKQERDRVVELRAQTETLGNQVVERDRAVTVERENVELERARVTEARRNVAEFNQSVERLRADIDGALVDLERLNDPKVAQQVRAMSERIAAARANIRLSKHFTLADLTQSETSGRRAIENAPDPETFERLRETALLLDRIKDLLGGCPLRIVSGYRGATLSKVLGGAPQSAHATGYAVDIVCPEFGGPFELARAIERSEVMQDVDQLVLELGRWVHISADPKRRRQVVTTYMSPTGGMQRVMRIENMDTAGQRTDASAPAITLETRAASAASFSLPGSAAATGASIQEDVYFDERSYVIKPDAARAVLDRFLERLRGIDVQVVVVVGHADGSEGPAAQQLSVLRAEAVKSYLVGKGVDKARIHDEGKGSTAPAADNGTPEGRSRNRRVKVEAVGGKPSR